MANSSVPVTPGQGANVDTRTTSNGDHRQVIVIGDPDTDETAKVDQNYGIPVDVKRTLQQKTGTLQNAAVGIQDGTPLDIDGYDFVVLNVQGISDAQVAIEVSEDGTNWDYEYARKVGSFVWTKIISSNGLYKVEVSGMKKIRARISFFGAGTITITAKAQNGQVTKLVGAINPELLGGENKLLNVMGTAHKPVISPEYSWLPFNASNDVDYLVKNVAGMLGSIWVVNYSTSLLWLQIHNKTSVPTSGNTAYKWYPVPAGVDANNPKIITLGANELGRSGLHLDTGIAIGISTVKTTFTAYGTPTNVDLGGLYT